MAISFARMECVKRISGKNACAKSAYNSRDMVHFNGNEFNPEKTYNWSRLGKPEHHEILLPKGANDKFQSKEILWNLVEETENRKNSRVGYELVIALPDDAVVTSRDKVIMAKEFANKHFVERGFAVQLDVHRPEPDQNKVEHNWHAHIFIVPRRFIESGDAFDKNKARDVLPPVRGGMVIADTHWGQMWGEEQNLYFEKMGWDLRVDPVGVVSQKHLGPVRMRGRAFSLFEEQEQLKDLNEISSLDPMNILLKFTETKNIFSTEDVDRYLVKHVAPENIFQVREQFWKLPEIIQLYDKYSKEGLNKFTAQSILNEEKMLMRFAGKLNAKPSLKIKKPETYKEIYSHLNPEQTVAYRNILAGNGISFIEGHAGTGKSHLLIALKETYEKAGYHVRAFGPDNAAANVLAEKGFKDVENIYKFLFANHHGHRDIQKDKEVWIVDESGKLGTRPLLEFLKTAHKNNAQVILSGNSAQLPSVERGGMFKAFCQRYGCEYLENIQRQKEESQRVIAKKLACGEIGLAINHIHRTGGFEWSYTKEASIERLVENWISDKVSFPSASSLIIAHTNKEVRVLNEVVRLYRREMGEIEKEEYQFQTPRGKIYLSVGDKVEFRKKDTGLQVVNGTEGVLTHISQDKFIVSVSDGKKNNSITVNPAEYNDIQLAYATTYFRSQGRTVDRAYVLHSPMLNKEMFYVGLTRHVRRASYYVARTEAKCLSDLKWQAMRASLQESTSDFSTYAEISREFEKNKRIETIQDLKESESIFKKIRGYGLHAFDHLKERSEGLAQQYTDRLPNKQFFKPIVNDQNSDGKLEKLNEEHYSTYLSEKTQQKNQPKIKPIQANASKSSERIIVWDRLSEESKKCLKEYYTSVDYASSLHTIVELQAKELGKDEKLTTYYGDWQKACSERNKSAYHVVHGVESGSLKEIFNQKTLDILNDRASRHEKFLRRDEWKTSKSIEDKLSENIESLLFKLFPEGPTNRNRNGLRFGSKGSLSVVVQGDKVGSYYDFEKGEGGGLCKLIQNTLAVDEKSALEWARGFLNEPAANSIPKSFSKINQNIYKENDWVSLKPENDHVPPPWSQISKGLEKKFHEQSRHVYRDENGNVLYYNLRLVEKNDPSKKAFFPLSYGYNKGCVHEPRWTLKGFQTQKNPIYNLDQISPNPSATILIVEGEKTADSAMKYFPGKNMICVTWAGGASSVSKTDWSPFLFRDVIIWPDNDEAGFNASEAIISELRTCGINSLKVVNRDLLSKELPKKWDLADMLPDGKSHTFLNDMILQAQEKAIGLQQVNSIFKSNKEKDFSDHILRANEVQGRVTHRLWEDLERKHGAKTWLIKDEILAETAKILAQEKSIKMKLENEFGVREVQEMNIRYQTLYEWAQIGNMPSLDRIGEIKQAISSLSSMPELKHEPGRSDFAIELSFRHALDLGLTGTDPDKKTIGEFRIDQEHKLSRLQKIQEANSDHQSLKKDLSKEKEVEIDF